jgi:hypothetical protein
MNVIETNWDKIMILNKRVKERLNDVGEITKMNRDFRLEIERTL